MSGGMTRSSSVSPTTVAVLIVDEGGDVLDRHESWRRVLDQRRSAKTRLGPFVGPAAYRQGRDRGPIGSGPTRAGPQLPSSGAGVGGLVKAGRDPGAEPAVKRVPANPHCQDSLSVLSGRPPGPAHHPQESASNLPPTDHPGVTRRGRVVSTAYLALLPGLPEPSAGPDSPVVLFRSRAGESSDCEDHLDIAPLARAVIQHFIQQTGELRPDPTALSGRRRGQSRKGHGANRQPDDRLEVTHNPLVAGSIPEDLTQRSSGRTYFYCHRRVMTINAPGRGLATLRDVGLPDPNSRDRPFLDPAPQWPTPSQKTIVCHVTGPTMPSTLN